ncbi:MAG: DUF4265 domain-containing protein [Nocardioidaceae bacterium]
MAEEAIDATAVEEGVYRLVRSPAWAFGIARGDLVTTQEGQDGSRWITSVYSTPGHWCSRVVPFRPLEADAVIERLNDLECGLWIATLGLVVVEVDASADPRPILAALTRGREEHLWDFNLGVTPA